MSGAEQSAGDRLASLGSQVQTLKRVLTVRISEEQAGFLLRRVEAAISQRPLNCADEAGWDMALRELEVVQKALVDRRPSGESDVVEVRLPRVIAETLSQAFEQAVPYDGESMSLVLVPPQDVERAIALGKTLRRNIYACGQSSGFALSGANAIMARRFALEQVLNEHDL